jgi:hypothetical protein
MTADKFIENRVQNLKFAKCCAHPSENFWAKSVNMKIDFFNWPNEDSYYIIIQFFIF